MTKQNAFFPFSAVKSESRQKQAARGMRGGKPKEERRKKKMKKKKGGTSENKE